MAVTAGTEKFLTPVVDNVPPDAPQMPYDTPLLPDQTDKDAGRHDTADGPR